MPRPARCQEARGQTTTSQSEMPRSSDHRRLPQTSCTSSILLTGEASLLGQIPSDLRPRLLRRGSPPLLPLLSTPAAYPRLTHEVSKATHLWSICTVPKNMWSRGIWPHNEIHREPSSANNTDNYITIYDKEPTMKSHQPSNL